VFVDSDVLFIRSLDTAALLTPAGAPYLHRTEMPANLSEHQKWYRTAQRLLALPADRDSAYNYVGNLIVWQTDRVRAMRRRISEIQHEPWQRAVARTRTLSEYMLYGVYADATRGDSSAHLSRPSALTCSVWTSSAALVAAEVASAIRPEHVALHLQSTLSLPVHERRGLCSQVLTLLSRPPMAGASPV
jgi:hypothetical protein